MRKDIWTRLAMAKKQTLTIRYLNEAYHAMVVAAAIMECQYGEDFENVIQLRGAADMIKNDWIPSIEKQEMK